MMKFNKHKALALKLHSLNSKDREWILSNLDKDDANVLSGLLDDIKVKRLSDNPYLIDELLSKLSSEAGNSHQDDEFSDYIKIINRIEHGKIIELLKDEEAWILALLFNTYDWSWREELERKLSPTKKMQIRHYLNGDIGKIKYSVKRAILNVLCTLEQDNEFANKSDNITIIMDKDSYEQNELSQSRKKSRRWWGGLWQ